MCDKSAIITRKKVYDLPLLHQKTGQCRSNHLFSLLLYAVFQLSERIAGYTMKILVPQTILFRILILSVS